MARSFPAQLGYHCRPSLPLLLSVLTGLLLASTLQCRQSPALPRPAALHPPTRYFCGDDLAAADHSGLYMDYHAPVAATNSECFDRTTLGWSPRNLAATCYATTTRQHQRHSSAQKYPRPPRALKSDDHFVYRTGKLSGRAQGCVGYLPPGTSATGGASNMVLAYMDYRSELGFAGNPPCDCPGLHYPTMVWNASNFSSLLRYSAVDRAGAARSSAGGVFFDSFLFLGTEWYNQVKFNWERAYVNDSSFANQRHAVKTDWIGLLHVFLQAVENLEVAAVDTNTRPTFVIAIPYPDKRASRWGVVDGRWLNFSVPDDQVIGVTWYVHQVVSSVDALNLKRSKLIGFYWLNEGVDRLDHPMVRAVAAQIHSAQEERLFLMWVPSYRASFEVDFGGWRQWRDIGFDFVTLQPNWAFANVPAGLDAKHKFALVANASECLGLGVEMELPMVVRNPMAGNWTESFDAYAGASRRYNWSERAMRTWYYGNSFNQMRSESPVYYAKLYQLVTGQQFPL